MKPFIRTIRSKNENAKYSALLIAGTHGNELTPLQCLIDFFNTNDTVLELYKYTTFLIGSNPQGIRHNMRNIAEEDKADLNRRFDPDKKIGEEYDPFVEILKLVEEHDVVFDVHSSPRIMEHALIDVNEYTQFYVSSCLQTNVQPVVRISGADTIKNYCTAKKKIAYTIELNGMEFIDKKSVAIGAEILHSLLTYVADKELTTNSVWEARNYQMKDVLATKEGIINYEKKIHTGSKVVEHEEICSILNFAGEVRERIYAPVEGTIVSLQDRDYCIPTDAVAIIQPEI